MQCREIVQRRIHCKICFISLFPSTLNLVLTDATYPRRWFACPISIVICRIYMVAGRARAINLTHPCLFLPLPFRWTPKNPVLKSPLLVGEESAPEDDMVKDKGVSNGL